ncbi:unnamed protein product [Hymenolepis diminuta]|uniref:Uncharacterized protein n=1 Tax=Hymenolepis diminuta TaxID=6216 RepID=A0A564Z937_HYMDI|nr:unnamed protein product [Hymenolepis diminuta]
MRCEATFPEGAISKVSYVADRNINLVGLDWIDELNYIQFPDKNEICRTPTLEPTNTENLVGGCNQCLHVSAVPQLSKSYSLRTQL